MTAPGALKCTGTAAQVDVTDFNGSARPPSAHVDVTDSAKCPPAHRLT
jgi:hypothetical protein